jgi:hypothetical protein
MSLCRDRVWSCLTILIQLRRLGPICQRCSWQLVRIGKEVIVTYCKILSRNLPGRLRETTKTSARFEVFTTVTMIFSVFWGVTPCSLVDVYRRFGGHFCFHLQGRRISKDMGGQPDPEQIDTSKNNWKKNPLTLKQPFCKIREMGEIVALREPVRGIGRSSWKRETYFNHIKLFRQVSRSLAMFKNDGNAPLTFPNLLYLNLPCVSAAEMLHICNHYSTGTIERKAVPMIN